MERLASIYLLARSNADGLSSPCKVGIARNPPRRASTIATACPFPIRLVISCGPLPENRIRFVERAFHMINSDRRLHGEWFDIPPAEAEQLIQLHFAFIAQASGAEDPIGLTEAVTQRHAVPPRA